MNKVLIAYFSQEGVTAAAATQIARRFKDNNYEVDLCNILDGAIPLIHRYDILGIGSPVYILRPPFNIMEYIETLPDLSGMPFFLFITNGSYPGTAGKVIRRALLKKGGKEVGYTRYTGEDDAMVNLNLGYPTKAYLDSCSMDGSTDFRSASSQDQGGRDQNQGMR
jgi:flavodoxin